MNEVKNLLTDIYGKITDDEGNLVYKTREDCVEEIVANSMFDAFTNEKFVKKMMNENASLFGRIANKVKEVLADIRKAVATLGSRDAAIRALKDDIESLEKIDTMFDSLLEKAGESYKAEHGAGQKNNAEGSAKSSGIKFSTKTSYDSKMQNTIDGYIEAVDEKLLSFVKKYYENPNADFDRLLLSDVGEKQAKDLKKLFGIDFSGYSNAINKSAVNHINKRHGENGKQDNSMSNINDFARLKFIIDNYDDIEILKVEDGDADLSKEFRNSDNTPANLIRMKKKVNGTFYVVEAVAENKYKKIWVASAYIQKNGAVTQVPTTKSSGSSLVSPDSNNSIPNDSETVKQKLSVQASKETLSELKEKREGLVAEYRELRTQIDAIKESDEYKAFDNEVRTVRKNGSKFGGFEAVKAIRNRQKQCLLSVQSDFNCDKLWSNI